MDIKCITLEEFTLIYKSNIKRDFPKNERRPLFFIKRLYKKELYKCYVLYEQGKIAAYACFLRRENISAVLLDYYAVEPHKRGTGIGGRFLTELATRLEASGIVLECEMPKKAETPEEKQTRERRIEFYKKNGAELSSYAWHAFGVDYNLMWLPVETPLGHRNLGRDMVNFYSVYFPKFIPSKSLFHFYILNKR